MEIIKKQKRKFTSLYKARVALEAISGKFSIQELMEKFDLNRKQILNWKDVLISKAYLVFEKEETENYILADKEQTDSIKSTSSLSERQNIND